MSLSRTRRLDETIATGSVVRAAVLRRLRDGGLSVVHIRSGVLRESVYREWLQARFENKGGAVLDVDSAKLVSFRRTRAIRKLHSRYSEGPDALMRGELEITDGAKFAEMLAGGIGRHKAYGYGMLLLRPASSYAR